MTLGLSELFLEVFERGGAEERIMSLRTPTLEET